MAEIPKDFPFDVQDDDPDGEEQRSDRRGRSRRRSGGARNSAASSGPADSFDPSVDYKARATGGNGDSGPVKGLLGRLGGNGKRAGSAKRGNGHGSGEQIGRARRAPAGNGRAPERQGPPRNGRAPERERSAGNGPAGNGRGGDGPGARGNGAGTPSPADDLDFDFEQTPASPPPDTKPQRRTRPRADTTALPADAPPDSAPPRAPRRGGADFEWEEPAGGDAHDATPAPPTRRPARGARPAGRATDDTGAAGPTTAADPAGPGVQRAGLPQVHLPHIPGLAGLRGRVAALRDTALGQLGRGGPPRSRFPVPVGKSSKPGRIKKIRLFVILAGLGLLAMVSTVFGMMMAVASDLPAIEAEAQYNASQNSVVYSSDGDRVGMLTSNTRRLLVDSEDISQWVKAAVVSIEDQRFYEHRGVDYQGIGRAVWQDILSRSTTQGASTITQQFVKNALEAQDSRTMFQKLREAALAYHIERQWDKDKILTQYLNTIYFGEGAYGVESAARTFFGARHAGECGEAGQPRCASVLLPEEAAMLAGMISSPTRYSPRTNPDLTIERRNTVLQKMVEQGALPEQDYEAAAAADVPRAAEIEPPAEDSVEPYFTSWLRQQLVDRYGAGTAFGGGLSVTSTIDLDMQEQVESIAYNTLSGIVPTSSVAVVENETGAVKAMIGGSDFTERPFNLATQGHRQPGSAFKPFTLATALAEGRSSGEVFSSEKKTFPVPNAADDEVFEVNNYEDQYYGSLTVADATRVSDNSVYAELGLQVGTRKIAQMAQAMGIQTHVSRNPAMTLGGLKRGVTPLEMAYAYSTLANGGERVSGNLSSTGDRTNGIVAFSEVRNKRGETVARNKPIRTRVMPESVAEETISILRGVVSSGTARNAAIPDAWGKTGTTENNGDAWFCGGVVDGPYTACVWVGHFDTNTPMETEYGGKPVDGGTYPAIIWRQVMLAVLSIGAQKAEADDDEDVEITVPTYSGGGGDGEAEASSDGGGGGGRPQAPAPAGGGTGGSAAPGSGL